MVSAGSGAFMAVIAAFAAVPATAQSNPFMPPQAGMSREQIQSIVRSEIERSRASQPSTPTRAPGTPTGPGGVKSAVDAVQSQTGGVPRANVASPAPQGGSSGAPAVKPADPVADLLKEGGMFIGCVDATPIFKDKSGRRAYFTTKELRESYEARRFTRCS